MRGVLHSSPPAYVLKHGKVHLSLPEGRKLNKGPAAGLLLCLVSALFMFAMLSSPIYWALLHT